MLILSRFCCAALSLLSISSTMARSILPRTWRSAAAISDAKPDSASHFTVMQWNVLADGLAQTGNFVYAAKDLLTWRPRFALIAAEIADVSPDILCMQEVNNVDYFASLLPEYAMIWVPKLLSPAVSAGATPDGIAVFVRRSRFAILDVATTYYRHDGLAVAVDAGGAVAGDGAGAAPARAVSVRPLGNQAGVVLALSEAGSERPIIVATTHLKAKGGPVNDALRARQIAQLLAAVRSMRSRLAAALRLPSEHAIPVVVTGDMNSDPRKGVFAAAVDDASLAMHSVYNEHTTAHAFGGAAAGAAGAAAGGAAAAASGGLPPHPPAEVYASGEPSFTTWKYRGAEEGAAAAAAGSPPTEKRHTIDYIFVSGLGVGSGSSDDAAAVASEGGVTAGSKATGPLLKLTGVRNLPTAAEIGPAALPCARFPSDHLSLAATFEWA